MLREVKVEEAIGMALAHDLTQIIPGKFKGRLFRKGHIVREEDIPALLSIGKEHIYAMELQAGFLHEDEAAQRMATAIRGEHIELTEPNEGKVTLKATVLGQAKVAPEFIGVANAVDQVAMASVRTNTLVKPGQALVGTRVIPLIVAESTIAEVERLAADWRTAHGAAPVAVKPLRKLRAGLVTTGS
jgi:hypothetical protein